MPRKIDKRIPRTSDLLQPVLDALRKLGGSGENDEILHQVILDLNISDEVADLPHAGSLNRTELSYQVAWAKTYLKKYGAIENSSRGVWSITTEYTQINKIDPEKVIEINRGKNNSPDHSGASKGKKNSPEDEDPSNDEYEFPEEFKPWREKLAETLQNMDPFGFERLAQRVLRECGFTNVVVTKKQVTEG